MKRRITVRMSESELTMAQSEAAKRGLFVNEVLMLGLRTLAGAPAIACAQATLGGRRPAEPAAAGRVTVLENEWDGG